MSIAAERDQSVIELTTRAVIAGVLFGAANAYLGLKVGLTVSTSIPIAVLTGALFKLMPGRRDGVILEANISPAHWPGRSSAPGPPSPSVPSSPASPDSPSPSASTSPSAPSPQSSSAASSAAWSTRSETANPPTTIPASSGMIAGEGLVGVLIAFLIGSSGKFPPLAAR